MKAITPFRALATLALLSLCASPFWACADDSDFNPGRVVIHTTYGSEPTCATAASNGELCTEGDIETEANLDVAGTATLTGAVAAGGALTVATTSTVTGQSYGPAGWELIATAETAAVPGDCNKIYACATHLVTVLLPAVGTANAGCCVTLINTAADGVAFVGFSINASDAVFGEIGNASQDSAASGTDDEAFGNTRSTAIKGDRVKLCSDGVTGWFIAEGMGVWASVAQ